MIYLDNAATTYPKPKEVFSSMARCMELYGGNPGRGGHALSLGAAKVIYRCREQLCALFGTKTPENVIFTYNATYAIYLAFHALYRGGHIVMSDIEHNSVARCVYAVSEHGESYSVFHVEQDAHMTYRNFLASLRPDTKLCILCHQSNVCPLSNPIEEIGRECRRRGIRYIIDVSQSAGKCRISMPATHADALCMPGHKGLLGPQGTGVLLFSDSYTRDTVPSLPQVIRGGSGAFSKDANMPPFLPERYEAGTPNTVGISGLSGGLRYIESRTVEEIEHKIQSCYSRLRYALAQDRKTALYLPHAEKGSVLLCNRDGIDCEETATLLDERGICTRAGLHCAPLAHKNLGTNETGGVRISPGIFTTQQETDRFLSVFYKL